jgi:CubicO group peptidase (beta-lactamase class C family)
MRTTVALLCCALAAGAPPAIVTDPAKTGLDPARLKRIPARMQAFVDRGTVAGVVTLVARRGHVAALDAVGFSDLESRRALSTNAIFQIHSMTKPIVCFAILQLAEQGLLALTDPVEKYLPEFRGQQVLEGAHLRQPARPVWIRDLMTHTSGMALNPPPGIGELHGALHKTLSEVTLILSQQPLAFDPGSRWQYSNTGIATLARIIEVTSGLAFEKYLEARIFQPLGMQDTFIYPPAAKYGRMPVAYILKDGKPVKYTADPLGEGAMKFRAGARYPLPEGGLYSTAADLFAFSQMMLNKGIFQGVRLLSRAGVELMTTNHTGTLATSAPGAGWGLGWFVIREPLGELSLLSKGAFGHGGRYGTYQFIDPERELIGLFLIHREGGAGERNAFVEMALSSVVD